MTKLFKIKDKVTLRVPDKLVAILCISFLLSVCLALIILKLEFLKNEKLTYLERNTKRKRDVVNEDDDDKIANVYGNRRIPRFVRTGVVIPDETLGTRRCDDFYSAAEKDSFVTTDECSLSDGFEACLHCSESRSSLRICAHFDRDTTIFDPTRRKNTIIRANSSAAMGYCVRADIASELENMSVEAGRLNEARERCRITNADWLLTRRDVGVDTIAASTTYQFACVCRYPHLLTNAHGPQSACTRDVSCGDRGRLDDLSLAGEIDPFIDGRCICDEGWISERSDDIGPYCREATFEEWPSVYYGVKRSLFDLELNSREVSGKFADRINARRADDSRSKVWLPDPCRPKGCDLAYLPPPLDAYFCRDRVSFYDSSTKNRGIESLSVAFYSDRDYLRNNEGLYPNRCVQVSTKALDRDTVVAQYMSQAWNDGSHFAQELGFLIKRSKIHEIAIDIFNDDVPIERVRDSLSRSFASPEYVRFVQSLTPALNTGLRNYGILWTHNADYMRRSRENFNLAFSDRLLPERTDLGVYRGSGDYWLDYPYYTARVIPSYYAFDETIPPNTYEAFRMLKILGCGETRSLEYLSMKSRTEISERRAYELLARLPPTVLVRYDRDDRSFRRHEINPAHDNKSGCVIFSFARDSSYCAYGFAVAHVRGKDMRKFCFERSLCAND